MGAGGAVAEPVALSDEALANRVITLRRRADAAEAAYLDALRELDQRDVAPRSTGLGTRSWLRDRLQLAPARTGRDLRLAQMMASWPPIGDAARAGEISAAHVGAIADAAVHLGEQVMAETVDQVVAAARVTDPQLLRAGLRSVTGAVDSPRANRAARRARHDRWLDVDPTFEGTVSINGVLDAESGALVTAVLEPLARRTGPEDERAPTVRRADALAEASRRLLDLGDLPVTAGQRPHLNVTVAAATLTRMQADPAHLDGRHRTVDAASLPAELGDASVLTDDALRQLACDAVINRIVLDAESVPLELGRSARLVSPGQRRALFFRDHGCRYPGCDRPHQWTDAHHLVHWIDGGNTDLTNLISLCRTHHRMLHDGDFRIRAGHGNTFLIVSARGDVVVSTPNATATTVARQVLGEPSASEPARAPSALGEPAGREAAEGAAAVSVAGEREAAWCGPAVGEPASAEQAWPTGIGPPGEGAPEPEPRQRAG